MGSMRPAISVLDADAIGQVHQAALRTLERVGVRFGSPDAEALLQGAGQTRDPASRGVRIAPDLVGRCLRQLPRQVRLAARDPQRDVTLGTGRVHACLDGQGTFVLDAATAARRPSTLEDLVQATRLSDALESVDYYWAPVVAGDLPGSVRTLAEFATGFAHTSRHVQHELKHAWQVPYLLEMADALLGDRRRLRERPILSVTVCPVSPLQHEAEMTSACIELARNFVPIVALPMPLAGATAPVTLAGTLVQTAAEFLSAVVLYQLAQPGCPMIFGIGCTILDMRTGLYAAGAPELPLLNAALTELGHHYGVPVMAQGVVSDAKLPGAQAGYEKAASALVCALAGSDVINGLGLLDSHQLLCPEQLVIDDEIFRWVRRVARGFELDSEHVMLDLVAEVGSGGNFLAKRSTLEHLRRGEHFRPRFGFRGSWESWARRGTGELAWARDEARRVLREHAVRELPREVATALREIVVRAAPETDRRALAPLRVA
jgi:trimethylamine--corrinoid protein Co-methyltransferase